MMRNPPRSSGSAASVVASSSIASARLGAGVRSTYSPNAIDHAVGDTIVIAPGTLSPQLAVPKVTATRVASDGLASRRDGNTRQLARSIGGVARWDVDANRRGSSGYARCSGASGIRGPSAPLPELSLPEAPAIRSADRRGPLRLRLRRRLRRRKASWWRRSRRCRRLACTAHAIHAHAPVPQPPSVEPAEYAAWLHGLATVEQQRLTAYCRKRPDELRDRVRRHRPVAHSVSPVSARGGAGRGRVAQPVRDQRGVGRVADRRAASLHRAQLRRR